MRINMAPHSGVVAYNGEGDPFPVVGWLEVERAVEGFESVALVLIPLVLNCGVIQKLDSSEVQYQLVGMTSHWFEVVAWHGAGGGASKAR